MRRSVNVSALVGLLGIGGVSCDAQVDGSYEGEPLKTLKGSVAALQSTSGGVDVGVLWFMSTEGASCSGPVQSCRALELGASSPDTDFECLDACGERPACDDAEQVDDWLTCQSACGAEVQLFIDTHYSVCAKSAVGQRTPVVGDFPAQFSLDMLAPPPAEAFMVSDTGESAALGWFVAANQDADDLSVDFESEEAPAWLVGGSETHVLVYAENSIPEDSSWGRYLGGSYAEGYHLVRVEFGNRCGLSGSDTDEEEPSYADVPNVCGNGLCEGRETCDNCSDCIECGDDGVGTDSGRTNLDGGFRCVSTSSRLVPSPDDDEQAIELKLAPPDQIDWPIL